MQISLYCFLFYTLINLSSTTGEQLIDPDSANGTETYSIHEEIEVKLKANEITELEYPESGQCIFVKSEEGLYSFYSSGNVGKVCGLYFIAEPNQIVNFQFDKFDISCSNDGLLSIINGWELNGQFFPALNDNPATSREDRFMEFCGLKKPSKLYSMSQNVGLIEFRIPNTFEGFRVNVTFVHNPKPCNVILQNPQGVYTIRNYGLKINCSVYIMFPESIHIISSSVGVELREDLQLSNETIKTTTVLPGLISKCKDDDGASDYVEFVGGDGLDTDVMQVAKQFCGIDKKSGKHKVDIVCENTAVKMVSSGEYVNSVTIAFDSITEIADTSLICPAFMDIS